MSQIKHEDKATYQAIHTPEKIASRLQDGPSSVYLKDFDYPSLIQL